MSKRDELAAVLGEHRVNYRHDNVGPKPVTAENLRYTSCEGCDWLGGWHDEAGWELHAADAVLAWLDGQFGEGLRWVVADAFGETLFRWHGTASSCDHKEEAMDVLAAVRERLGLSGAAQDAQDGAVGPGSVPMGTGEGAAPNGAQIEDFEGER